MNARENGKSEKQPLTPYNVSVTKIRPGIYAIGGNAAELNTPDDNDNDSHLKLPRVQTFLAPAIFANRIMEWGDKLILKKIDPWAFFRAVGVKIRKYDGQLIHFSTGLSFEGSPGHVFWNFIEPFLERGIDEWLEHIADLCLQNAKPPELYLETVKSSLLSCISNVYTRMSEIDYKIRKGEASCLASANFGQNTRGRDTSENRAPMISYLNKTYERVLEATKTTSNEMGDNTQPPGKVRQKNLGRTRATRRATPRTAKANTKAARDQVFICYSRKDKRWHDDLQTHLKPYMRNGSITAWSDEQIAPASKWFPEIKAALASAKVAVLLVTPNFLASEFIHEHELTPLLKEADKSKVSIVWIPVGACSYDETPLKDYEATVDPDRPLANMKKADRDKVWVEICRAIKKAVGH